MQFVRKILFPFAILFGWITFFRNKLYDWAFYKSYNIPQKSICIGNLSIGGTGKTPLVTYLGDHFKDKMKLAILSRGYGRTSKGFLEVFNNSLSEQVGDEPLFYAQRFDKNTRVFVAEKRAEGIQQIAKTYPDNNLLLLDDAFQHRAVKAGFSIVLTDFSSPFFEDHLLPTGNLREYASGVKRADCVIVSKCPISLSPEIKTKYIEKIACSNVFFSSIIYEDIRPIGSPKTEIKQVLLVTGIANPQPLIDELSQNYSVEIIQFDDHHSFNQKDIEKIHQKFDTFVQETSIILTTEKDYTRLKMHVKEWELNNYPWYYQPIALKIEEENKFIQLIERYVNAI